MVAPFFSLKDLEGNVVNAADLLRRGPLVLSFYRGVWYPLQHGAAGPRSRQAGHRQLRRGAPLEMTEHMFDRREH
jgi:hypothetical protein